MLFQSMFFLFKMFRSALSIANVAKRYIFVDVKGIFYVQKIFYTLKGASVETAPPWLCLKCNLV